MKKILLFSLQILLILTLIAKLAGIIFHFSVQTHELINGMLFSLIGVCYILMVKVFDRKLFKALSLLSGCYLIVMPYLPFDWTPIVGSCCIILPWVLVPVFLKERIEDLHKTSNGEYIDLQMIESKLTTDRYIAQCVIIAKQRKFVSALIVPDYKLLKEYAEQNGCLIDNNQQLCQHPLVVKFFTERIDTLQQDLAGYEKIKSFLLLPEPFTIENGELTNTLKVKRNVVCRRYADVIDRLYEDAEKKSSAN